MYAAQVKRFLDFFGKNVKIIIFEELLQDSQLILNECLDFLAIDPVTLALKQENPSVAIYSAKLQCRLRALNNDKLRLNPNWSQDFFIEWGKRKQRPATINSATRRQLLARYQDDVCALEKLLNKDLSLWRR